MRTISFAGFTAALAGIHAGTLAGLATLAGSDDTASHVVAVPFVVGALILRDRESIFASCRVAPRLRQSVAAGCVILVTSGLLATWFARGDNVSLSVTAAALAVSWVAGFLAFYGGGAVRVAIFPLLFLMFMVPLPDAAVQAATTFLKSGSATAVHWLLTLSGTPLHRDGFVFSLPGIAIEIADECSGIRSSLALLLTSLLAGYTFLSNGWNKAWLVVAILPVAILKNAIRISTLSLLAVHVDPAILDGALHHEGGVVFFLLALALLSPLFFYLRHSERTAVTGEPGRVTGRLQTL